jgi:hypothetical protein
MKAKVTVSPTLGIRFNVARTDFSLYRVLAKPAVRMFPSIKQMQHLFLTLVTLTC